MACNQLLRKDIVCGMTSAILMALGAGVANAGVAVSAKAAEQNANRPAPYAALTLGVAALTAAGVALIVRGVWADWRLWAFGIVLGSLYVCAIGGTLWANKMWPPSLVWSTANMAFLLPILFSAVLLREPLRWIDLATVLGVGVMLAGLATPAAGLETAARSRAARWGALGTVFLTNGLLMFGFKLQSVLAPGASTSCLSAIIYGCGSVFAWGWYLGQRHTEVTHAELRWGATAGVGTGMAILALLHAMHLPAAVAFPLIQGTSLVGGVALCALIFHELWSWRKTGALALGIIAMLLAGIR